MSSAAIRSAVRLPLDYHDGEQDNLDLQTRDLVRFAAAVAQGYEPELRERVTDLRLSQVPAQWVEELCWRAC